MSTEDSPLISVLTNTTVEPFRYGPDKPLVVIRAHWPLDRALRVLSNHGVQSAPLLRQVEGGDPSAWEISGVVDVQDLAAHVLDAHGPEDDDPEDVDDVSPLRRRASQKRRGSIASSGDTVYTTANLSCNNPTQTIASTASIGAALPLFTSRVRRVLITDATAGVVGVMSQTDVLRTIASNYPALDTFSQVRVCDIPAAIKHLKTCSVSAPASEALNLMLDNNVSAVALVDDTKHGIVANFSMTDVREMCHTPRDEWPALLAKPALEFLAAMRHAGDTAPSVFVDPTGRVVDRIISVRPTDVVGTAVNLILATGLHRVWVVDRDSTPHGLLSISDILRVVHEKANELRPDLFPIAPRKDSMPPPSEASPPPPASEAK